MIASIARALSVCCAVSLSLTFAQAPAPSILRMVDLNGDGELDLLEGLADGTLVVSLNVGDRYFEPIDQELPRVQVADVVSGDLNDDGFVDLYLVSPHANVALAGDGTGLFVDATSELGLRDEGVGVCAMLRDLDGDGRADLVLVNRNSDVLFWNVPGGFERDARTPFVPAPTAVTPNSVEPTFSTPGRGADNSPNDTGVPIDPPRTGAEELLAARRPVAADPTGSRNPQPGGAHSSPPSPGQALTVPIVPSLPFAPTRGLPKLQVGLSAQQQQVLSLLSVVDLPDGLGGLVQTLRISGANLQVVNGLGLTESLNGLGNLIVGYNELGNPAGDDRTGSHNLIVGLAQNHSSYGGQAIGSRHAITGPFASVSGGQLNTASGFSSSITGGYGSRATGLFASVTGGRSNAAEGTQSSVSGGFFNTASGERASVSAGYKNTADGFAASVSGGSYNTASGGSSYFGPGGSVSGGRSNTASGFGNSVSGGYGNLAAGAFCSVSGGKANTANGGYYLPYGYPPTLYLYGGYSSVSGGVNNTAWSNYSQVSGGANNYANGGSVSGGNYNQATGFSSSVSGGRFNAATGDYSSVSGGNGRTASGMDDWAAGSLFEDN